MASAEEAKTEFNKRFPTSNDLRKAHPDLAYLMSGEFGDLVVNDYNDQTKPGQLSFGVMVTRPLLQGRERNVPKGRDPEILLITPGHYVLDNKGCVVELAVLEIEDPRGKLWANDGFIIADTGSSSLGRYGGIASTSGHLFLGTSSLVASLLMYRTPEERKHGRAS